MIATRIQRVSLCVVLTCFALGAIGCSGGGEANIAVNKAKKGGLWGMRLMSPAFTSSGTLDQKYTADGGQNVSPPLKWNAGPNNVVEYAIIVEDGDRKMIVETPAGLTNV